MQYSAFEVDINPWDGPNYEVIARAGQASARQVAHFPLSPSALAARLPAMRRALSQVDLGAERGSGEDERGVEEFALLLYRFVFSGEVRRLFDESRAAAVGEWKGLRLVLRVNAVGLQGVPWECLWDILAFDLRSLKRGMFDVRIERSPAARGDQPGVQPARELPGARPDGLPLHPSALSPARLADAAWLAPAEAAFYAADFESALRLLAAAPLQGQTPYLRQAREFLARAQDCLAQREPSSTVPPRAASDYRRAWEAYSLYRFDEAARWLDEAWLLAKDWGIAEWPEARAFHARIQRSQAGYASYLKALACRQVGDLPGAREALAQAQRADPLEAYLL